MIGYLDDESSLSLTEQTYELPAYNNEYVVSTTSF